MKQDHSAKGIFISTLSGCADVENARKTSVKPEIPTWVYGQGEIFDKLFSDEKTAHQHYLSFFDTINTQIQKTCGQKLIAMLQNMMAKFQVPPGVSNEEYWNTDRIVRCRREVSHVFLTWLEANEFLTKSGVPNLSAQLEMNNGTGKPFVRISDMAQLLASGSLNVNFLQYFSDQARMFLFHCVDLVKTQHDNERTESAKNQSEAKAGAENKDAETLCETGEAGETK